MSHALRSAFKEATHLLLPKENQPNKMTSLPDSQMQSLLQNARKYIKRTQNSRKFIKRTQNARNNFLVFPCISMYLHAQNSIYKKDWLLKLLMIAVMYANGNIIIISQLLYGSWKSEIPSTFNFTSTHNPNGLLLNTV